MHELWHLLEDETDMCSYGVWCRSRCSWRGRI